jgi:hypothetical protein
VFAFGPTTIASVAGRYDEHLGDSIQRVVENDRLAERAAARAGAAQN